MSEISQIKERFLQFVDYKGFNQQEIFDKLGFSKWNFTGKSLKSELGGDSIREISLYFPEISLDWLVCGKGQMLRNANDPYGENPANQDEIIRLLREKIDDQQEIIDLLKDKIELLQGGSAGDGDNMPAAAAG